MKTLNFLDTMKNLCFPLFGIFTLLVSGCSTTPMKDDQSIFKGFTQAFAPIYDISLMETGALDILYCTASFTKKYDRLPQDYAELLAFVKQSDGYLIIGEYERVDLKPVPNDGLQICYVKFGQTNEM